MTDRIYFTDSELLYAATACCQCGAGLAYPFDHELAMQLRAWVCSAVLRGDTTERAFELGPFGAKQSAGAKHDYLPFNFWKVREETSINNQGAFTTRPAGTVARIVGKAKCPKCEHTWESEPYDPCGAQHHWFSGPCPGCGYAVGGGASHSSDEGEPIESRYTHIVLTAAQQVTK